MADQTVVYYLAPITYLYATGLILIFILLAVTLYKILLPGWVRAFRHPRLLRWLTPWITLGACLVLIVYLWFTPYLAFIPLAPDPILNLPLGFWLLPIIWIISLIVVLKLAIRPHIAR